MKWSIAPVFLFGLACGWYFGATRKEPRVDHSCSDVATTPERPPEAPNVIPSASERYSELERCLRRDKDSRSDVTVFFRSEPIEFPKETPGYGREAIARKVAEAAKSCGWNDSTYYLDCDEYPCMLWLSMEFADSPGMRPLDRLGECEEWSLHTTYKGGIGWMGDDGTMRGAAFIEIQSPTAEVDGDVIEERRNRRIEFTTPILDEHFWPPIGE